MEGRLSLHATKRQVLATKSHKIDFVPFVIYRVRIALTRLGLSSVTIPLRRYQTPSRVRQTSSASILPPLVRMMTGLPPCRFPIPGPLVETGSVLARECEEAIPVGEGFSDGDGDGEGETSGEGEGVITTGWAGVAIGVGVCVAADVLRAVTA